MAHIKHINDFITENNNPSNMVELIEQALDLGFEKLQRQVPKTKKSTKSISIMDVNPMDLVSFMKENNVPDTAYFDGRDNGYDAFDDILLSWKVEIPTTDQDKLKFKKKKFDSVAWNLVYKLFLENGYERTGYNTGLLKQFDDTTVYDMYIDKDFDRLFKYYSLRFKKV